MIGSYRTIRSIFPETRPVELFSVMAVILALSVLEAVGIGLIFVAIKVAQDPASILEYTVLDEIYRRAGFESPSTYLQVVLLGLALFFVLKNGFAIFSTYWQTRFAQYSGARLSAKMLGRWMHAPYTLHLQRDWTEQMALINEHVARVINDYVLSVLTLLTETVVVLVILSVLIAVEPVVTIAAAGVLGVGLGAFFVVYRNRFHTLGQELMQHGEWQLAAIRDALKSLKEARVLGREAHFHKTYEDIRLRVAHFLTVYTTYGVLPRAAIESLTVMILLGVIIIALGRELGIDALGPVLAMFGIAALRLLPSANRMLFSLNKMRFAEPALRRLEQEIETLGSWEHPAADEAETETLTFERELVLENVSFSYPDRDEPALRDITLRIPKGESIALVGPSGAGKSTLADVILGLLPPQSGSVRADGRDIYAAPRAWYGRIGYVPQTIHLLNTSLTRNIAFGLAEEDIDLDKVRRAVRLAHLDDVVEQLPGGLEEVLGEEGIRLSGGERQRVGIARALYHDPALLVFDEATSALDSETEYAISKAIDELSREKTVVIISHRLASVRNCDRIVFLRDNRIDAVGTYDQLVGSNEAFSKMVAVFERRAESGADS